MRRVFVMLMLALSGCTMTKKIGQVIADPGIQVGDLKTAVFHGDPHAVDRAGQQSER
ncbi:Uncharacterised protein [Citrobacter koseri]|uniref:Lipoprotein n=1 Tax=Citrobacter koseri TaxID=545 RepID=A0A447UKJ6_CITKO|nr:Uncharacterised protein [Citrobacter koseri]